MKQMTEEQLRKILDDVYELGRQHMRSEDCCYQSEEERIERKDEEFDNLIGSI